MAEVTIAMLEQALREMHVTIRRMPSPVQEDIEAIARSFRNTLALGHLARIALMVVAAEVSIEGKRAMDDGKAPR